MTEQSNHARLIEDICRAIAATARLMGDQLTLLEAELLPKGWT